MAEDECEMKNVKNEYGLCNYPFTLKEAVAAIVVYVGLLFGILPYLIVALTGGN